MAIREKYIITDTMQKYNSRYSRMTGTEIGVSSAYTDLLAFS